MVGDSPVCVSGSNNGILIFTSLMIPHGPQDKSWFLRVATFVSQFSKTFCGHLSPHLSFQTLPPSNFLFPWIFKYGAPSPSSWKTERKAHSIGQIFMNLWPIMTDFFKKWARPSYLALSLKRKRKKVRRREKLLFELFHFIFIVCVCLFVFK